MNHWYRIIVVIILPLLVGFYSGIKGNVVDAVTGKPIEGAVVLAQWTTTHGLGLSYHTLYKIEETVTNKDGVFSLSGVLNPFVDQPEMVIYKKGYVPYRNDMTFDKMETFKKVVWKNNMTYRLEHWKEGNSKARLYDYLVTGIIGVNSKETPIFQAISAEALEDSMIEIQHKLHNKKQL